MKLVVQRVSKASVDVEGKTVGEIGKGFLVLLGIAKEDTAKEIPWFVQKLVNLRIFEDAQGKMNLSLKEVDGSLLIVSQFTLYGNCANGRRPDFLQSAPSSIAEPLYQEFLAQAAKEVKIVESGVFGADMKVSLVNDGPVTIIVENTQNQDVKLKS